MSKEEANVHNEKVPNDYQEDKVWVKDHSEKHLDQESSNSSIDDNLFSRKNEEDLDIAIINDVAITEDDPTLKAITVRSIIVGVLLAALSASVHQVMSFKPVGIPLTNTFMLIIAYIVCTAWARLLPHGKWINPGPFNVKEHTCIYVTVSAANASAYATYILSAQQLYYNDSVPSPAGQIFFLLGSQMVGYGIAGNLRKFLVYAPNMTWPTTLPVVSLLKTFNADREGSRWRTKFFFIVFLSAFVYEFIPQYIFPMLGGISIICLARNDSAWVQRLFGGLGTNEGLGIFQFSFDWNLLSNYTPLVIPLWIQLNVYGGVLLLWILAPVMYYYNVWNAQKFPFLSLSLYQLHDNGTVNVYPQSQVLNADYSLNQTLLEQVGRPHFTMVNSLNYVAINFGITATITHVALFYGKEIVAAFRNTKNSFKASAENDDIHMKLMRAYPEVPNWWYILIYLAGMGLNIGIAYANKSQLPWWGVIFAIVLASLLSLPLNMIMAVTGYGFGLNVVTEMVCGFVLPGYPIANMYFKTLGYTTKNQAGILAQDLKIGHYLKVPPRMTFLHQILGTVIGCIFNYIVNDSITTSKHDILLETGNQFWSGSSPQQINSAAITWGAVGPLAMFGPGTEYYIFLWAFVIGFVLPVPGWLLHKKWPKAGFNYINVPMILHGFSLMPGSNTSWIMISFMIVLVSQGYLKRRYSSWFAKHNYLVSAALDSGTSLMVFFISMALYGGANGISYNFPTWWGNRNDVKYMDQCCMNCS
ncbi:Oligopeptide transporter 5 [Choanephora cucurbitarum]|uniref:Oligopeptide transporter 5 n=1 Tax=Choanephora cucurbitarum TaxID=101091 RepID=A0A1C7NA62_9FUNG|nr:Oligopeptide transporter 5 [Choanephora cucurbitarum]